MFCPAKIHSHSADATPGQGTTQSFIVMVKRYLVKKRQVMPFEYCKSFRVKTQHTIHSMTSTHFFLPEYHHHCPAIQAFSIYLSSSPTDIRTFMDTSCLLSVVELMFSGR